MARRVQMGNPLVGVSYIRVSTSEQRLGPLAQSAAIEAWAAREGILLVASFVDRGVSGGTPHTERPALLAALSALETASAGVLVAAKRDRLARNVVVAASIEAATAARGATVRTADGQSDGTGSIGLLSRGMYDLFNAYEKAVIGERTRAALAIKRARGEMIGGLPYGWKLGPDGKSLEPDADEQHVVVVVCELRRAGGSIRGIARELERRGLRTRTGRPFEPSQVVRMLDRAAVAA